MNAPPAQLNQKQRVPATVWIGLAIAVFLDAPVQLLWKSLMERYGGAGGSSGAAVLHQIRWFILQPRVWLLLALFASQFLNWMWVLGQADLSFAQPFTALSYLTVSAGAAWVLHEHLSIWRIAGIALILCGVILIGSTPHLTPSPAVNS
jgi:drug/metabolite transporter (DMT)-like permease